MGSKRLNRRELLKGVPALASGLTLGAVTPAMGQTPASPPMIRGDEDQIIAYGNRSKHVTSVRIPHGGRPSPDNFGLTFHVAAPLQDSVGVITPSSLHYYATTRGSFLPDIDPREHSLMIHGLVDRPLTFTMEDLKRLPSVTRLHFIECAGNRASARAKTVQETHGMTSCAEWTGVLLSVLLKECGVKGSATWFVAEGAEEVKGASSMPIAKAMDDGLLAYGMNGEAVRPQNGFPLRLMVPGFEGIFHTKWLRRIKLVDRYYMNYNDYGHLDQDPKVAALDYVIGPKSVITFPSGGQQLPGQRLLRDQRPGLVRWRRHSQGGGIHRRRQAVGITPRSREHHSAWRTPGSAMHGTGTETRRRSCRAARTNWARFNRREPRSPSTGTGRWIHHSACRDWTTAFSHGGSPAMGACTMGALRASPARAAHGGLRAGAVRPHTA